MTHLYWSSQQTEVHFVVFKLLRYINIWQGFVRNSGGIYFRWSNINVGWITKMAPVNCNQSNVKTSPKGFSASKCNVGNWIFSKSWEFFVEFFGNSLGILWELSMIVYIFKSQLLVYISKVLGILWEFFGNSL